ncbi:hypothetical protein MRB53_019103 [Persea americana]|uniref:Uncharacterized protein n=1 Tax=Persea americana TaxID=3435 RepID=A0ACC2M9W8_PERAE|nr:hypothetical protein MRB53_019103 [Persea americana]
MVVFEGGKHDGHGNKVRWGELEEDDGEDLDFLLPPRVVIGPDNNGIKKVIEYKFNDDGNKVKITTTTRSRKLAQARLTKRALQRHSWPKFRDASHEDKGPGLQVVKHKKQRSPEIPWLLSGREVLFSWPPASETAAPASASTTTKSTYVPPGMRAGAERTVDQKTGMSRGFGFVNFVNKEDADRAINKLNGYGYDNLILRVEWATPRSN